ncbi:ABC transporter permease [Labrys monachus]|uniref:ABC transport system permease protein n=1 Tax=Labrys monachus TaxID=217067 RepID=A0ABU0FJX2_9HYPH|nr:ABC transporter permease [Labrys monachus]MDQ0394909.1 putative ABC transport system permease protein [Labrys monachus]
MLRFVLTVFGVGLLMASTIGMLGMYRGIVYEALVVIDGVGADLWVVEGGKSGPFAESSAVPANLDRRVAGVSGVAATRRFIQYNQQFEFDGLPLRMSITGVDFPSDRGSWIPLIAGRYFQSNRYEAIADKTLGFAVGDEIRLGKDTYTIVGVSTGQVDMSGDGLLFVTIADAQVINQLLPSEAILLNRAAKEGRDRMGLGNDTGSIAAVIVETLPGADKDVVRDSIKRWGDVEVLTKQDEEEILLNGRLGKLRVQILAFTTMILLICCAVIAMTIYTMTIEKVAQISLLKLIGARDRVIVGMIAQQAALIGFCGLILAIAISFTIYPRFPRTVLITASDLGVLSLVLMALSLAASWFAIRRALAVRAQEVLA